MKITTDEAFEQLKEAGIVHNRFIFLKWVREGKLHGTMTSKKKGYRFHQKDIDHFLEHFEEDDEYSMSEDIQRLQTENEDWRKKFKMPKETWIKENLDLRMRLQQAEKQNELLERKVEDQTIRVRVE